MMRRSNAAPKPCEIAVAITGLTEANAVDDSTTELDAPTSAVVPPFDGGTTMDSAKYIDGAGTLAVA